MEGYVIDAIPYQGKLKLVLDGFKEAWVKTTYPIYVVTENPERIMEHPSVLSHEEEEWRTVTGERTVIHRFELRDLDAYIYISKRERTVNKLPTVLSQTLDRLGALPFRRIRVNHDKVESSEDPGLRFPDVRYASVITLDWYGPSEEGNMYEANVNGFTYRGLLKDLDIEADVIGCMGRACDHVKAPVKLNLKRKRSPVSIKGLIEWSYTCKTLIRELANSTIGKALTTNEAWVAIKRRVVVPDVVPRVEKLRKMEDLSKADKGGLVLFPRTGCFNEAWQVDFSSMYPSLIIKYNISAETVDECEDLVTEIGHSLCMKKRGIVPEALSWLVERKENLKKIDEERAEAIKWILVASFGYLGYRNSKFGKIEAYELVTYFARKTLRRAIETARALNVEVLHGIVDSLIVRGNVKEFVDAVREFTGLKLHWNRFDWVVLGTRRDGLPYPMRYFGLTEGVMKHKGIVRRNMPNLVKDFISESMRVLSKAKTCEEVKELRSELIETLREYERRALNGEPEDYVMWINGTPYVRGIRGFYDARAGYFGRDPLYYLDYLRRTYTQVLGIE
ncbi:MAG: DNA polymerase domain-containing protein [Metallosphaera sp.]|uniref:DNA-directed DNA polymerase n=1 Tax=Metallosphaera cuprina (strain Ar-4) TaxID=1006006 RepID=F4G210_METCR|nr:DNA polymerase domain-containing protein [Metallosphaera cuprina]AEB94899.1 DNA polymerase B region [Metallosphaera cuprina Ar-4]